MSGSYMRANFADAAAELRAMGELRRFQIAELAPLYSIPPDALGEVEMSATIIDAEWLNRAQEEIMKAVDGAGMPAPRQFCIVRKDAGCAENTRAFLAWMAEGGIERLLERALPPPDDLPDVPLHQRGFGVRDEGTQ